VSASCVAGLCDSHTKGRWNCSIIREASWAEIAKRLVENDWTPRTLEPQKRWSLSGLLRVTDHKSGKFDGTLKQVIDGGKTLQPVLYALAAEKLFAGEGTVTEGRLYFCTSTGGFAEQTVPLNERARDAAAQVAEAVGDAIARPFLPAAPAEGPTRRSKVRTLSESFTVVRSR
jgi:hypothetical protein